MIELIRKFWHPDCNLLIVVFHRILDFKRGRISIQTLFYFHYFIELIKLVTSSAKRFGSSQWRLCPVPLYSINTEPFIAVTKNSWSSRGPKLSFSPQMIKAGLFTWCSAGR